MSKTIETLTEYELQRLHSSLALMPEEFAFELVRVEERLNWFAEKRKEQQRKWAEERAREEAERKAALAEAERRWNADPINDATARGWEAMRRIVPNLDGVPTFYDLPPALKYRYAEFARAVLEVGSDPNVVLSNKQLAAKAAEMGDS